MKKQVEEWLEFSKIDLLSAKKLIEDEHYRSRIISDFSELREKLGEQGASDRAAKIILEEATDQSIIG